MTKNGSNVAVVTGAASGMGRAAAKLMADAGWPLLLCDLNAHQIDSGKGIETLSGDIAHPSFDDALVAALDGRAIGAFVHCAGLSPTMGDPARILEVNLAATLRLATTIRTRMAPGSAAVLFSSSSAHMIGAALDEQIAKATTPEAVPALLAFTPDSGAAYGVSKRGVLLLARREAGAFGRHGARIISISPGIIDTPMGRAEMQTHPIMQRMVDASPLGRAARAEEVAAVAVFLCSPAASFVTGVDILVDGGSIAAMDRGATSEN